MSTMMSGLMKTLLSQNRPRPGVMALRIAFQMYNPIFLNTIGVPLLPPRQIRDFCEQNPDWSSTCINVYYTANCNNDMISPGGKEPLGGFLRGSLIKPDGSRYSSAEARDDLECEVLNLFHFGDGVLGRVMEGFMHQALCLHLRKVQPDLEDEGPLQMTCSLSYLDKGDPTANRPIHTVAVCFAKNVIGNENCKSNDPSRMVSCHMCSMHLLW